MNKKIMNNKDKVNIIRLVAFSIDEFGREGIGIEKGCVIDALKYHGFDEGDLDQLYLNFLIDRGYDSYVQDHLVSIFDTSGIDPSEEDGIEYVVSMLLWEFYIGEEEVDNEIVKRSRRYVDNIPVDSTKIGWDAWNKEQVFLPLPKKVLVDKINQASVKNYSIEEIVKKLFELGVIVHQENEMYLIDKQSLWKSRYAVPNEWGGWYDTKKEIEMIHRRVRERDQQARRSKE
jgi:hypothetical protein